MLFRCQFPVAFYETDLVICAVMVYGTLSSIQIFFCIIYLLRWFWWYTCAEIRKTTLLECTLQIPHSRPPPTHSPIQNKRPTPQTTTTTTTTTATTTTTTTTCCGSVFDTIFLLIWNLDKWYKIYLKQSYSNMWYCFLVI